MKGLSKLKHIECSLTNVTRQGTSEFKGVQPMVEIRR